MPTTSRNCDASTQFSATEEVNVFELRYIYASLESGEGMGAYKGLLRDGFSELVEKRSRFIGAAGAVYTEGEALAFIEGRRRLMPDAGHHVYAYRIGGMVERYSDDGEPSGTGGLPVLNVFKQAGIENAVAVVTRYFGGTLLGTGGLVHAYGHTAKAAVDDAVMVTKTPYAKVSVKAGYAAAGKIQYAVLEQGGVIEDTRYEADVAFSILWPPGAQDISKLAADVSRGQAQVKFICEMYCCTHDGQLHIFPS